MTRVPVVLHAARLPSAGVCCEAEFSGDVLALTGDVNLVVPVGTITTSTGGFDDDALFLEWDVGGDRYSAAVAPADRRALLAAAPATLRPRLQRGHGELQYHRVKWNAVLATLATLALLFLVAWWQSDAITRWLADRVSLETEERLGGAMLAQVRAGQELTTEGPAAAAVSAIGATLTRGSRYSYQWFVSDEQSVNAFAIPGGIVVVTAGLIARTRSAEELAGVLAHEVQHVERRHTLQQMIHTAGWAAILAVALGDVSAISGVFIHQLGNLRKSRQLESEADREGLHALARAGIPLDGLPRLLRELAAEEKRNGTDGGIALLSTHPATAERLAELEALAKSTACRCRALGYDWPAVTAAARALAGDN
jgi:Zn-dependent protease with chaperone function